MRDTQNKNNEEETEYLDEEQESVAEIPSKPETLALPSADEVLLEEFFKLVAQIALRLSCGSVETTSNFASATRHKQIRLITINEAARIPEIAGAAVFQVLCAIQRENTGKVILVPVEYTEKRVAGPIKEI
jgi:hypothetical protein